MPGRTIGSLCATLTVIVCVFILGASGPEPSRPKAILLSEPLRNNPYMTYSNPRSWSVELNSYMVTPYERMEFGPPDRHNHSRATMINDLEDAGIVFPVMAASGSSWSVPGREREVSVVIDLDRYDLRLDRHLRRGSRGPEMVFRPQFSGWTQFIRVQFRADMVCVDTHFDQRQAEQLDWPERWPEEAERYHTPLIDTLGRQNDQRAPTLESLPDAEVIRNLLDTLQPEGDRRFLPPVHEAKFLAARLIEIFEINQPPMIPTRNSRFLTMLEEHGIRADKFGFERDGNFDGFNVMNPDDAARNLRGSIHDRTALLTSLYRAAGIPARTVIGLEAEEKNERAYRSWTEFALYDADLDLLFWVPVDLDDLARSRVRSSQFRSRWPRFGSSKSLHKIVPIAFGFHPPDTNKTSGFPILSGIRPASGTDAVPMFLEQFMRNHAEPFRPASANP